MTDAQVILLVSTLNSLEHQLLYGKPLSLTERINSAVLGLSLAKRAVEKSEQQRRAAFAAAYTTEKEKE